MACLLCATTPLLIVCRPKFRPAISDGGEIPIILSFLRWHLTSLLSHFQALMNLLCQASTSYFLLPTPISGRGSVLLSIQWEGKKSIQYKLYICWLDSNDWRRIIWYIILDNEKNVSSKLFFITYQTNRSRLLINHNQLIFTTFKALLGNHFQWWISD